MRRQRLLWIVTLLLPFVLLAGAEGMLRLTGIGRLEPLFIPVTAAPGYLQPNPDAIRRFFPDPKRAPDVSIDTTWFPAQKRAGTLRIVVQGESSAAGFPYGRWASPAALLQQRLQRSYPDRNVEVINTAMAAVTSYVLLDFADEIIAQHPDAVVIYTGHNEYLGIGGVGSSLAASSSPTLARTIAALRRVYLYRALERVLAPMFEPAEDQLANHGGTLMARIARERSIPLGSPLFRQGEAQFRGNLERLLAKYQRVHIPVFIGTLASNLRDQPPFVSTSRSGGESAQVHYDHARQLDRAGHFDRALAEYTQARDLDGLRFRAPESFDALIRGAARAEGATVVDVHGALARAARDGIVGADLMLEHVHPNVEGYFQLASAYYPPIVAWAGPPAFNVDDATARRELPVTELDRLAGEYRVLRLKHDWPFVPQTEAVALPTPANRIEQLAQAWFAGNLSWVDTMRDAIEVYQAAGNTVEAARCAVNLADAFVTSDSIQYMAGRLLLRAEPPERAPRYLQRAIDLNAAAPIEYRLSLAEAYARAGHSDRSIATLQAILREHPTDERAKYWLQEMRARGAAISR
jgi:Putative Zn-dependent protease, contains TPR repeats